MVVEIVLQNPLHFEVLDKPTELYGFFLGIFDMYYCNNLIIN